MYIIYGAKDCGYCQKAKRLLDKNNKEYVYHDITKNKSATMDELAPRTQNQRTVPIVFKDTEYVGGYRELANVIMFEQSEDF